MIEMKTTAAASPLHLDLSSPLDEPPKIKSASPPQFLGEGDLSPRSAHHSKGRVQLLILKPGQGIKGTEHEGFEKEATALAVDSASSD